MQLLSILDTLQANANQRQVNRPEYVARRVGRNLVWQVVEHRSPSVVFVKFRPNLAELHREVNGLQLAVETARGTSRFMSAELILADDVRRVIVTKSLPGQSYAEILRSAYRLDKNPLGRRRSLELVTHCTSLIVDWFDTFSQRRVLPQDELLDHSLVGVMDRINNKLDDLCTLKLPSLHSHLNAIRDYSAEWISRVAVRNGAVLGDASPTNFVFDGTRLGVIDFEDFGFGDPGRDHFVLDYHLQRLSRHWGYRSCSSLRQQLMSVSPFKSKIFQLEFFLDHVANSCQGCCRPEGTPTTATAIRNLVKFASVMHDGIQPPRRAELT